jgi:hypothetical protein
MQKRMQKFAPIIFMKFNLCKSSLGKYLSSSHYDPTPEAFFMRINLVFAIHFIDAFCK